MPNETLSVLTISTVTLSDTGLYTVVVSNTEGKDTSDEARLAVFFKPVITTQPKDTQVINAGKPVHFTVWASGNPSPKYQWGKNGLGIPKETLNVLTIPSVVMSDSGKYTVVVSNSEGSVVSDTARLIVKPPLTKPVITTQPKDSQAVLIGSKVTLSVSATGNPLPSYQWNKNGFSMPKETLNVLTISSVTVSDTGLYTVVVSNSEGSIISNQARLYIDLSSGPVIIKQPEPQTVSTGQSATFSVTAIGTPPLLYQWKKDNSTIGSATTSVYTINPASPLDSGSYKVVIQNSKGSVVSNAVKLTVTGEMSLIPQPVPQTAHKEF